MATNKKKGTGMGAGKMALIAGAAAATAAAGYFFYGPKGTANRKKLKAWVVKAKGDVMQELEKMEQVSKEAFEDVVDTVTKRYAGMKEVGGAEATKLNKNLKKHWKDIERELSKGNKVVKKSVKKGVKKAKTTAKKAAKRSARKK